MRQPRHTEHGYSPGRNSTVCRLPYNPMDLGVREGPYARPSITARNLRLEFPANEPDDGCRANNSASVSSTPHHNICVDKRGLLAHIKQNPPLRAAALTARSYWPPNSSGITHRTRTWYKPSAANTRSTSPGGTSPVPQFTSSPRNTRARNPAPAVLGPKPSGLKSAPANR